LILLEVLGPPYDDFIYSRSEDGRRQYVRVPVCLDTDEYQVVSVIAYFQDFSNYHELGWGIHVMDAVLQEQWINFERARGRACLHEDVWPHVIGIANDCCKRLIAAVEPQRIYRKAAEPTPWGYRPERFDATTAMLEKAGYRLLPDYPRQRWECGRWEWIHERV
jgi:hypothetical protein